MVKYWANWGALPEGSSASVFSVCNTSHNHAYVIAEDEKSAMAVACSAGHVRGTSNIDKDYYWRNATLVDPTKVPSLQKFESEIQLAVNRRLQGTLHFEESQVLVGNEVIKA